MYKITIRDDVVFSGFHSTIPDGLDPCLPHRLLLSGWRFLSVTRIVDPPEGPLSEAHTHHTSLLSEARLTSLRVIGMILRHRHPISAPCY